MFQKIPAHIRRKKHNCRKNHQKDDDADQVFRSVIRVKCDAIEWHAIRSFVLLDLNAIRIVRSDMMQSHNMNETQDATKANGIRNDV